MHFARGQIFLYRTIQWSYVQNQHNQVFFWDQDFFAFCKSSSHNSSDWVPMSSAKVFFQETPAWYQTLEACQNEMSTTLKTLDGLNNAECKKGQMSNQPLISYVPEIDIVTPKEEPQTLKVKLLDDSYLNMPIYSHGNTKEYLAHIVAVLQIINQKGCPRSVGCSPRLL
jgi:hypothetical protein